MCYACHTLLGRISKLDCSTTKGAPIPNETSSESSRRNVFSADPFGTDIIPTVEVSTKKIRKFGPHKSCLYASTGPRQASPPPLPLPYPTIIIGIFRASWCSGFGSRSAHPSARGEPPSLLQLSSRHDNNRRILIVCRLCVDSIDTLHSWAALLVVHAIIETVHLCSLYQVYSILYSSILGVLRAC